MAQANAGAAGANGAVPHADGAAVADRAVPVANGAVLPPMDDGARVRGAPQAVAPVAGPLGAPVARPLFPQGLVDIMDGFLFGPLPAKSNGSFKILPKIADETEP